jgi:tetratricopeptide (TPR) repeat protein
MWRPAAAAPTIEQWQSKRVQTIRLWLSHRNQEAEAAAEQLLDLAQQMGPLPKTLGLVEGSLTLLSNTQEAQGHLADAIATRRRLLGLLERYRGTQDNALCVTLTYLARLYQQAGNGNEAEAALKRTLAIKEHNDPDHLTGALMNLAKFYAAAKHYALAEPYYLRLVEVYEKEGGERNPRLQPVFTDLVALAKAQGDQEKTKRYNLRLAKTL